MSMYPEGHPRRRQILGVLCLSLLVVVIDNTILNTALPTLAEALRASTTDLQWITDAYTLVFAALLILAGSLGDGYGRRRALIFGLAVFALGSTAAALSGSASELIAARAVMGLGGAFVMPATLSILSAVFPAKERPAAIGAWSAVAGIGIVIGPTLGGFLLDHFSWGAVFWVNVPLVAVALALVLRVIDPMPGQRLSNRLDLAGAVLSCLALLAVVDSVIEGPERGWTSPTTLAEAGAGAVLLASFVIWELRAAHPLLDVRVFTHRAFSAAAVSVGVTFFALFGSLFALTQFLQLVQGYTPFGAGVRALPFAAAVIVMAPLSAVLVKLVGVRAVVPVGLTCMGGGLLLLSGVGVGTGYPHIALAVAIMGAGMGLVVAPAGESIMTVLPSDQAGVGSAVNDTVQELGGSLGVAVIGSLVSGAYRSHLDASSLPAVLLHPARASIGAADAVARLAGPAGRPVAAAAHQAFAEAMATGFVVAAVVALAGAVLAGISLPGRQTSGGAELDQTTGTSSESVAVLA